MMDGGQEPDQQVVYEMAKDEEWSPRLAEKSPSYEILMPNHGNVCKRTAAAWSAKVG